MGRTSALPALALLSLVIAVACEKRGTAPPASWEPRRSCAADDECRPAPTCCPIPCNSDVIRREDVDGVQRRVDAQCTKEERARCPQAGSCPGHVYACVRSRCTLVMEGSPDWPKDKEPKALPSSSPPADAAPTPATPDDASSADRGDVSCKKDDECVPLGGGAGCCPSPCPRGAVNRRAQAKVEAELAAACAKQPKRPCISAGACRGHAVLCVRSECFVVYEGEPNFRPRAP